MRALLTVAYILLLAVFAYILLLAVSPALASPTDRDVEPPKATPTTDPKACGPVDLSGIMGRPAVQVGGIYLPGQSKKVLGVVAAIHLPDRLVLLTLVVPKKGSPVAVSVVVAPVDKTQPVEIWRNSALIDESNVVRSKPIGEPGDCLWVRVSAGS